MQTSSSEVASKFEVLLKLLQCGRRQQKLTPQRPGVVDVARPTRSQEGCKVIKATNSDISTGSEPGDVSTDDDQSGPTESSRTFVGGGTSGDSDIETEKLANMHRAQHPWRKPQTTPNTGAVYRHRKVEERMPLAPPPGLEAMAGQASNSVNDEPEDAITALKKALDNLAPGDLATVKYLLDSKTNVHASPVTAARPFKPWGSRAATLQPARQVRRGNHLLKQPPPQSECPKGLNIWREGDSLAVILRDLVRVGDDSRIVTLKKIQRLGFESSGILQTYLSKFGTVESVRVCHNQYKRHEGSTTKQVRPGILGFAVFSKSEAAAAALGYGSVHVVNNVEVNVLPYRSQEPKDEATD